MLFSFNNLYKYCMYYVYKVLKYIYYRDIAMFLILSSIESEAECTSRLYRTIKPIVILRLTVLDRL